MALQHLRSNTASKRPTPASMADGQLAINTNATSPGVFFKDAGGALIKVGPVHVGTSAPNSSPAGSSGNAIGEQWLDTSGGGYVLKIWDGSAWRTEAGEFVDAAGDTMTGALILPSGTAAAPALGVGSTDNGIYSPGADQVAISTNGSQRLLITANGAVVHNYAVATGGLVAFSSASGGLYSYFNSGAGIIRAVTDNSGTAGTLIFATGNERMRIDNVGRVGIGTTSPSEKLDVANGSIAVGSLTNTTTTNTLISGYGYNLSGTKYGNVSIRSSYDGGSNLASLEFYTSLGGTTSTERMRIDTSGRLLVGTSTARNNFYPSGSEAPQFQLETTSINTRYISVVSSAADIPGGSLLLGKQRSGSIGGNTIVNTNDELGQIGFMGCDGNRLIAGARIQSFVDGAPGSNDMPGRLVFSTTADGASNPTERMRITSDGKVGVGTSLPSGNLDVRGLSGTSIIRAVGVDSNGNADAEIFSTGTTGTSRLFFADTAAKSGSIIYSHSNNSFAFATNGGGADVVIDSDGRLLVGTSTSRSIPSTLNREARIQLEGGDNNKSAFSITNTTNGASARAANIRTARIRGTGAVVQNDTLGLWSFYGHDGTDFIESATIRGMVDGTPGANEMPGRLVFSTTADSASNMTERMRIDNAGTTTITSAAATAPFVAKISTSEVARIDSSGRLLVGTSTGNGTGLLQVQSSRRLRTSSGGHGFLEVVGSESGITSGTVVDLATLFMGGNDLGAYIRLEVFAGIDGVLYGYSMAMSIREALVSARTISRILVNSEVRNLQGSVGSPTGNIAIATSVAASTVGSFTLRATPTLSGSSIGSDNAAITYRLSVLEGETACSVTNLLAN